MALAIADAGADVILTGRTAESLEQTADEIRQFGRDAMTIAADMSDRQTCESTCRDALETHGPIDILINNIGGRLIDTPTETLPLEDWQRIIDLNLTSTFLCTKIIGGEMLQRDHGGRVINIASISGMIANRGIGGRSYETSKAAVIQFTRATAADWAPHAVTVNAICPGGVDTPMLAAVAGELGREVNEFLAEVAEETPNGRIAEPGEVASLVLFLASDAGRHITGTAIPIDGGQMA